eukprot:scaffold15772_cov67-Skeletonema_dohrnii-CCMP3373.AAC.1
MISYKSFITLLTLSLGRADHDVNEKYRLFDLRYDKQRIDGWQDSVAVNVDVNDNVNTDVSIDCNEGEGWSKYDSKSGKSKSGKCNESKSGKSKSAKS